jgi:hypothetical protein
MRSLIRWSLVVVLIGLGLSVTWLSGPTAVQSLPQAPHTIYDDALANSWQDWSWAPITRNLNNSTPIHGGSHSIAVTFSGGWGGLQFGHQPAVDLGSYDTLRFWIHGGTSGGQSVTVHLDSDTSKVITPQANTWRQIDIPLSQLGGSTTAGKVVFWNNTGNAQSTFYLDDIQFVNTGLPTPTPVPPGIGPALSVDVQADRHPISPYIYGMNFADENLAAELNLPVRRWGGNSTSRYNWQLNVHNTGSDWYFENIPDDNSTTETLPDGSAVDQFVDQDRRTGTQTIVTMPLIGWTPKRRVDNHPYDCGFKISKYGGQRSVDPWDTDCGSGVNTGGNITGNDPTDTSTAITTTFVINWINHLKSRYDTAANGGVLFYNLDNEPMLWNSTHRDVHPLPTTYNEMRDKTYASAAAIKQADPSAKTLGPVVWGWCAYFFSAQDGCGVGTDYTSHGNTAFIPWYLQQMKAYEQAHGVRILDYLDLHGYPAADNVSLSPAGDTARQALRLRSTRSLWDPTYVDESWISDSSWESGIVKLIPRMREWVSANYTGTKLAITEYNWGALDHINGAVTQADVLGIFGREGLDLATLWGPPTTNQPGAYAFRLYRNYDGQQHTFGDVSVRAASVDQGQVAIYAAQRSNDNALTIMVINKSLTQTLTSPITISSTDSITHAAAYRYSAANLNAILRQADQPIVSGSFSAALPAQSVTLFVTSPENPLNKQVFLPVMLK